MENLRIMEPANQNDAPSHDDIEGEELKGLRVGDLIPLKQRVKDDLISTMETLDNLTALYFKLEDPLALDKLKREYNAHLQRYAVLFSKIKVFKGSNHTYLEHERKRVKADCMKRMISNKMAKTDARDLVYDDEQYVKYVDLIRDIMKLFIKAELMYDRYSQTLQCIIQSISLTGKIMERDVKTGS